MKPLALNIVLFIVPFFVISTVIISDSNASDSVMRIIGDKASPSPSESSGPTAMDSPSATVGGSSTVRIIGVKSGLSPAPDGRQTAQPEPNQDSLPKKEIRIIGDKIDAVRTKNSQQPISAESAEIEQKARLAEEERAAREAADRQIVQRLEALKAEEERKAAELAEQERLKQLKIEQENEAALQAAIRLEQERLAREKSARENAEAEAAKQADILREERMAAARKAVAEQKQQENRARIMGAVPGSSAGSTDIGGITSITSDSTPGSAPESIWDLYLSAKANDPALGRTEARVTGSKADSDLVFSGLLPHLDSRAGVQQISQTLSNYTANDVNNNYTALNYNITARFTLLSVPTLYALSASAASLRGEQAGVANARQNLIVKLTDSYFSLLKAQADKQIARGEINRLKQVLDQSQAFLREGTGDIIAVYEAQSRLDGAAADLTRSESTLRLAEQKLSTVVGKSVAAVENYLPRQPSGPEPDNLDWWLATMEKEQPLIRQAREGLVQTAEQLKSVKAEYLPVLQASGGYDVNRGTAALPTAEVRQWFVGATVSLPIYSGGETSAKVRRAVASEEERRLAFDETMDQQREAVKQAFFNLRYNISLIRALEQKKASAEMQLSAISKGRKIGTRNAIDVLNAEQAYSVALRDYKYALYDNFIRGIQLKSATGILAEADISDVSKMVAPTLSSWLR